MTIKIVELNATTEDHINSSQYNITRYLNECYKNGKEPSNDIMSLVDFNEVGFKRIKYESDRPELGIYSIEINETLAQNCITTLPFEAYEKFITADWINYIKERSSITSLTDVAINNNNLPLLERLHDLCLEKALAEEKSDDPYKSFIHTYQRDLLDRIVNVAHVFKDYKKKDLTDEEAKSYAEGYVELVKKCVCEIEYFQQRGFIGREQKPLKYLKNPDWTKRAIHACESDNFRIGSNGATNTLLSTLVSDEALISVFQDALIHISKRAPKDIKRYLGLELVNNKNLGIVNNKNEDCKNILSVSFAHGNLAAANITIESFGVTQDDCLKAYERNIEHELNTLSNYSGERMPSLLEKHFNTNYQAMKKEFFPDLETQYLPLFVIGKDEQFKQSLLEDKNILDKNVTSKEKISINECLLLAKIVSLASDVLSQEGKELSFRNDRDSSNRKNLSHYISEYILNHEKELMNSVDFKDLSKKYWDKIFGQMDEKIPDFVNVLTIKQNNKSEVITLQKLETIFEAARLNGELNIKTEEPRKKLKI
jgi:hypothetical protein